MRMVVNESPALNVTEKLRKIRKDFLTKHEVST